MARVHLVPYFGMIPLQQISPELVQGYISQKKAEGRLTPKTINNTLVPLKEMFKHAVRWGYLRKNPALYVEKPRVERKEMDFLKPEEIRLVLEHTHPRFHPLFLRAALTGMRRGELLALQWEAAQRLDQTLFGPSISKPLANGLIADDAHKGESPEVVYTPGLS